MQSTTTNSVTTVGIGDVYGAGVKMGVATWQHVRRLKEKEDWFSLFLGFLEWFSFSFWYILYLLHHLMKLLHYVPLVARYLVDRKVCYLGGYFPVFCKQVGPHWVFRLVDLGSNGVFLFAGSCGMAIHILFWEFGHPLFELHRVYLRKVVIPALVFFWLMPRWINELVIPLQLFVSFVVSGMTDTRRDMVVLFLAAIAAQVTMVPVIFFLLGLNSLVKLVTMAQGDRYGKARLKERVPLNSWMVDIFGNVSVTIETADRIKMVLAANSQSEDWKKVRVYAYVGDKYAYYSRGKFGDEQGWDVTKITSMGRIFDDDVLKQAMRFYASEWWTQQPDFMHGKPAATVLEALSYLVLCDIGVNGEEAVEHYVASLNGIRCFVSGDTVVSANSGKEKKVPISKVLGTGNDSSSDQGVETPGVSGEEFVECVGSD